ncbi:hypothetical protein C8F04DRAFT_1204341 [Mycena alexandri]|uniref:Uncharacterized protein n=1 Tax=Mycena alexandri TaxID=1745969 RepID=A0AAD6RWS4_9AGAR|nr:hypothetical protein C8F04DRAFT_1204341 [Mycena alexandri]
MSEIEVSQSVTARDKVVFGDTHGKCEQLVLDFTLLKRMAYTSPPGGAAREERHPTAPSRILEVKIARAPFPFDDPTEQVPLEEGRHCGYPIATPSSEEGSVSTGTHIYPGPSHRDCVPPSTGEEAIMSIWLLVGSRTRSMISRQEIRGWPKMVAKIQEEESGQSGAALSLASGKACDSKSVQNTGVRAKRWPRIEQRDAREGREVVAYWERSVGPRSRLAGDSGFRAVDSLQRRSVDQGQQTDEAECAYGLRLAAIRTRACKGEGIRLPTPEPKVALRTQSNSCRSRMNRDCDKSADKLAGCNSDEFRAQNLRL